MSGPALPPIGERLRQARMQRGMTVRGLARLVDVSASLISQIETGKSSPSVSTLYAITAALAISVEDVFGDVDGRVPSAGKTPGASQTNANQTNANQTSPNQTSANQTSPNQTSSNQTSANPTPSTRQTPGANPVDGAPSQLVPAVAVTPAGAPLVAVREPAALLVARAASPQTGPGAGGGVDRSAASPTTQGLRQLQRKRRVGPVVAAAEREMLHLDSGVTWELLGQLPDTHVDFLRITYAPGGSSSGAGVLMRHSGTEWGHVLSGQLTLTLGFDQYVLDPGDSVSFDCSTPHSYANHGTDPAVGVWFVAERFR